LICTVFPVSGDAGASAFRQTLPAAEQQAKLSPEQLDSLAAAIALYPDFLYRQVVE
jgi:hypothetical protein